MECSSNISKKTNLGPQIVTLSRILCKGYLKFDHHLVRRILVWCQIITQAALKTHKSQLITKWTKKRKRRSHQERKMKGQCLNNSSPQISSRNSWAHLWVQSEKNPSQEWQNYLQTNILVSVVKALRTLLSQCLLLISWQVISMRILESMNLSQEVQSQTSRHLKIQYWIHHSLQSHQTV